MVYSPKRVTIRVKVESALHLFPETRDDNRYLQFKVWDAEGLNLTPEQWAVVPHLSQPETIRRTGCKIKNED